MENSISYGRNERYCKTMDKTLAVKKKQLTASGNLSFIILFVAAIAVSDLYPPGGRALRRRCLKLPTCADDKLTLRFPVRWGPELGGTGAIGTIVPSKTIVSELINDNRGR